ENDINQISQSGSVSGAASAQVTGSTSSSSTSDTALTQLQVDVTNWSIATQCQTNTLKSLTDAMSATTQNIKS
ncbi:MAG: hypothetical protein HQL01_09775, partial [Nitrospirae bacterium]|nr:hypothetical protein [Nitrospirota bacterium]